MRADQRLPGVEVYDLPRCVVANVVEQAKLGGPLLRIRPPVARVLEAAAPAAARRTHQRSRILLALCASVLVHLAVATGVISLAQSPATSDALPDATVDLVFAPSAEPPRGDTPVAEPPSSDTPAPTDTPAPAQTVEPSPPAPPITLQPVVPPAPASPPVVPHMTKPAPSRGATTGTSPPRPATAAPSATAVPPAQTLARPVGGEIRPPAYPPEAARRREQGRVLVRVAVAADGMPASATVAQSSGSPRLDEAALAAVRRSRFTPATRTGQPVEGTADVPIVFRLQ